MSITIADKDTGEVYYEAETVLCLALVEIGSNRDDYYTVKCHFKVN